MAGEPFASLAHDAPTVAGRSAVFDDARSHTYDRQTGHLRRCVPSDTTPLSPGFNLDRYDRELRRPFPQEPQFATDSKVWRREHAIADTAKPAVPAGNKAPITVTSRGQRLEF